MWHFSEYTGLTKQQIRNKISLQLRTQKEEDQDRKSRVIRNKLFKSLVFNKAKVVMFYISFGGEVKTKDMIEQAQNLGKMVAVPVCGKNRTIRACILDDEAMLAKGPYGVKEPVIKKSVGLKDLDLVIVPGIAFDKKGARLGRGKGHYDRFLKKIYPKTVSLGLAYDFQIVPRLPATKRDVGVQKIIFA